MERNYSIYDNSRLDRVDSPEDAVIYREQVFNDYILRITIHENKQCDDVITNIWESIDCGKSWTRIIVEEVTGGTGMTNIYLPRMHTEIVRFMQLGRGQTAEKTTRRLLALLGIQKKITRELNEKCK